jgi:uncharacterized coiled-coil DUF342 family protein
MSDKLRKIVREEVQRFISENRRRDEFLEQLDDARSKLGQLRTNLSRNARGYTRGSIEKFERKMKEVDNLLDEVERIIIERR